MGVLLKQYESNLELKLREQIPEDYEKKTEYHFNIEETKEQIRMLLSDLNNFFEDKPKDKKIDRFKKLNEKFQYLLLEESNIKRDHEEGINYSSIDTKKIRYLPI